MAIPECRCSVLYHWKNARMWERASSIDPKRSGYPGWGIYLPKIKSFVTYEGSGYGTFAHEIMHPLLRANLSATSYWADEGAPSFFEKSFGYWEENNLILQFGFQNPWRVRGMGKGLEVNR